METKSCANCKYSENVRINQGWAQWYCHNTPFNHVDLGGGYKEDFETFYCSNWTTVFIKELKDE